MIYKTTPFTESTNVAGVLSDANNDALLPKVVYTDSSYVLLNTAAQQTAYTPTGNETRIVYPAADLGLEFGADYGVAIFLSRNSNYIFNQTLPAPTLTVTETAGVPTLEWTSAYLEPTKVYRSEVYATIDPQPSEYVLVAEVDGYTASGGTSIYVDTGISITSAQAVDYFVINANGTSTTETATVDAIV